jgi:hypothetical protein
MVQPGRFGYRGPVTEPNPEGGGEKRGRERAEAAHERLEHARERAEVAHQEAAHAEDPQSTEIRRAEAAVHEEAARRQVEAEQLQREHVEEVRDE